VSVESTRRPAWVSLGLALRVAAATVGANGAVRRRPSDLDAPTPHAR
jgi:hypothetical protein